MKFKYPLIVDVNNLSLLNEAYKLAEFTNMLHILSLSEYNAYQTVHKVPIFLELDWQHGLSVRFFDNNTLASILVKDIYTKINYRNNTKNELLIQAIKAPLNTRILDLTAGIGIDSVLMAKHGYQVTMVEKNPILATILYYALQQQYISNKNLSLIFANSLDILNQGINASGYRDKDTLLATNFLFPDIIYLDPMFNHKKTAKSKKTMQLIQQAIIIDAELNCISNSINDENELFIKAMQYSKKKVIVKRDNNQDYLVKLPKPTFIKQGKTVRYDIYTLCF